MWASSKLGSLKPVEIDESLFSHLKLKFNGEIVPGVEDEKIEEGKEDGCRRRPKRGTKG